MKNEKRLYNFLIYVAHEYIVPIIYDFFKINNPKRKFRHLLAYIIATLKIKHNYVYHNLRKMCKIIIPKNCEPYNFGCFITDLIPENELINGEYIFKKSLDLNNIDVLFTYNNIKLLDSIYL